MGTMTMHRLRALALLGFAAAGCGESEAEAACEDFIEAYSAKAADECSLGTHEDVRRSIFAGFAMFGVDECSDFDRVRDVQALYDDCLPGIRALTCAQVTDAASLPPSCSGQLQVEP
jgi:hypothetical protein